MKIFFAGGGTAGHVNPALAIAAYIKKKDPSCEIAFSGGSGGIEERLVAREGYKIYTFPLTGLSRSISLDGVKKNIKAMSNTLSAVSRAKEVIREQKPDIVVGTGGYACFPMVYAAQSLGVKTAVLEVNATPGVALKRLAKRADCIMVSFEETKAFFEGSKHVVYTGSPVRQELLKPDEQAAKPLFENKNPTVLCFWGSVGAMYMNKKMEGFIKLLALDGSFNLLQAAGKSSFQWMPSELKEMGVDIESVPNIRLTEYIYDMGNAMNGSDLVICRAGANTLAEVCACGKPSVIIPSPYVADNHQEKNARAMERAGASVVAIESEVDGKKLFAMTKELLADKSKLWQMSGNACALAKFDALDIIYKAIAETI
ncbi:MAG: undecaprenyldiphospho-muramoylpentapeptide beta-N-acetylglucosaminyltransferase [Clostridiaceae bacterium]|nr:undecaprenyldiphospho-muramoylpentapeptide beta-N-acetylglucosaminyltransferase [Clostridiaceae bacterium]